MLNISEKIKEYMQHPAYPFHMPGHKRCEEQHDFTEIDGLEVGFSGDMPTLIIGHRDEPGVIADVSRLLADAGLNIASMRVFRAHQGGDAAMAIELDARPDPALVKCLTYLHFIHRAVAIDKI